MIHISRVKAKGPSSSNESGPLCNLSKLLTSSPRRPVLVCATLILASVDYGKEIKEWSNMIGNEMGYSPTILYTMFKSFSMKNFKHGMRK